MAFEPISGTIGAVAFADQMFTRIVWVYKKYKLSEAFGDDYISYKIKYDSEIFRRHLREPLRSRLLQWISHLDECEKLVAKCEQKLEPLEDDTANQVIDETRVTDPLSPAAMQSSAPSTLSPSNLSSTAPGSVVRPSPSILSPATSATESVTLSLRQKVRGWRDHVRIQFRSKKHKIPSEPDRSPPSTEQNVPIAVDEQQSKPGARSPLDSVLPSDSTAAASLEIANAATEVHNRSNILLRVGWVAQSRSRFIELLNELREHADYFHSMIQLDQGKRIAVRSQQIAVVRNKVKQYRDIGDRLKILLHSLDQLPGSERAVFQLMLHDDPLSLQSSYRKVTRLLNFQPEGAAFYAQLLPPIEHLKGGAATTTAPGRGRDSARYFVFEVQQANMSLPKAEGMIAPSKLSNISHLLDPTDDTAEPLFARMLGCIEAANTTHGNISVFSDSTIHKDAKSLAESLNDENEKKVFQVPSQASFRTQLALVLTCSLIYLQRADGPRDLNATGLTYYDTDPASGHAAEVGHSRINPFVQLYMLGVPRTTTTSHSVLTSAARDDDGGKVSMIKSLGILLYEIGSWDLSVGNTIAEKASFVKARKAALSGTISVKYHDAIDKCIGVRKEAIGDLEMWIVQNVVGLLEQTQKDIKALQLIT
ncbi:hypothetical protein FSPOR_11941 [Fusarium sporotrichioides]|uniref:Prion-inhibition and propagation HeLo domain-containing protein n=1 Tax=Fusarium sporotrichioides TaxID=5514 RepID=A0A395RD34_FUSSP|nr:hypothetical protein FSPOR_11941 [Fusarium sporotrichioides]